MSVAAREAVLLDQTLERLSDRDEPVAGLAQAFFGSLGTVLDDPWNTATQDYAYPHLADARPPEFAEKMRLRGVLDRLAATDASIHRLVLEVSHLMRPGSALSEPSIVRRIAHELAG